MSKIALVLAIIAIGEGAVTLHLVRQVRTERETAQTLQARVTELEQKAQQPGATFVVAPTQPATVNPFVAGGRAAPAPPKAVADKTAAPGNAMVGAFTSSGPIPLSNQDQQRMREQMQASMERQRMLMRDPEYREAMRAQQKMNLVRSNPNLARDLDLTPEQLERLYEVLAEQSLRAMENSSPMWSVHGEQPDAAKMQEFHRIAVEQQRSNETELRRTLGDAKYREWQEYQSMAGVRWEADRVRNSLASAGAPLDESLAKPLLKSLHEQQMKMMQQQAAAAAANANASGRLAFSSGFSSAGAASPDMLKMQEQSLEMMAQQHKRQREALASVLTPEQLKIIEDEHNAEQQMQRAQLRIMRAQQEAGLLDPAQNDGIGFFQQGVVMAPSTASD
jgi:ribosomal protein L12E/L44/L45/RPP1/RPP2